MSVPNTVVKFVNKNDEIEDYDETRIADSIAAAIEDVEDSRFSLPERRSQRYAQAVTDRVYREYYDLDWLVSEFVTQYINYDPHERTRRMEGSFITERVTFVLMETYKDRVSSRDPTEDPDELEEFILEEIQTADVDPKYTHSLFPDLSNEEEQAIGEFLRDQVLDMSQRDLDPEILCPTREYIQDTVEKELKRLGEVEVAEGYMIYREGRKKVHSGDISELQFTNNGIHQDIVRRTIEWNVDHACDSVFELNKWMRREDGRDPADLVQAAEQRFHNDIQDAADMILERKEEIDVVIIAGPSCSNKTTSTVKIGQELSEVGLAFKQLNVDDYFFDLKDQPKDKFGDYDFEMPEAIDMDLLNEHLGKLIEGETIDKPIYDFEQGKRAGSEPFSRDPDEIILIDCLHGLYQDLTQSVPQSQKFRIYIESMNILRNINGAATKWADVRMLKRMIRDSRHRGYSMERTLAHWPYVRKGELKHIIPYIFSTEVVINAGLPYELPVLKNVIGDDYPDEDHINSLREDQRLPAYVRGSRTRALLETVEPFPDLDLIPGTSPIREFIGGSDLVIPHND